MNSRSEIWKIHHEFHCWPVCGRGNIVVPPYLFCGDHMISSPRTFYERSSVNKLWTFLAGQIASGRPEATDGVCYVFYFPRSDHSSCWKNILKPDIYWQPEYPNHCIVTEKQSSLKWNPFNRHINIFVVVFHSEFPLLEMCSEYSQFIPNMLSVGSRVFTASHQKTAFHSRVFYHQLSNFEPWGVFIRSVDSISRK